MSESLAIRFREAFARDLEKDPQITLRQGDHLDTYGSASESDAAMDAVTDEYLDSYSAGLPFLDPQSWRHYLPFFADYAQRHVSTNRVTITLMISSLRPPDRDPPRLGSLSDTQEALVRELLEMLAFSPESVYQSEACQALEEWWLDNALYRPPGSLPSGIA